MRTPLALPWTIFLFLSTNLAWAGPAELHAAARADSPEALAKELEAGTDIEAKTKTGYSALALAAYYGKTKALGYLLSQGADIETRQFEGNTPFILASWRGFITAAKILAEAGADIDAVDDKGYTALIWEAGAKGRLETLEFLIQAGVSLEVADDKGQTALMRACWDGRADIAARLLEAGAPAAQRDKKGRDAWWWAAYNGSLEAIDLMRKEAGAPELPRPSAAFDARASGYSEGLHFHLFCFELAEGRKSGSISRHDFPVGISYPSQIIKAVHSLTKHQVIETLTDHHGLPAQAIRLGEPIEVTGPRPLILGFASEVSIFEDLGWTYRGPELPLPKEYPAETLPYLIASDRYDLQSPRIQAERARLLADRPGSFELARRIWKLVYENVGYDSVPWPNSGSQVLEWGKGRCGEFTRAFITLARACGLPARGVWGLGEYIWLSDSDHAWPEFYIQGIGWLPAQVQTKPQDGFVFPVSFNSFYLLTRFSEETGAAEWPRPSQMYGKSLSKGNAPNGVGVFIRLPEPERGRYLALATSVIADEKGSAAAALNASLNLQGDARIFLLWLICASSDADAGMKAAAILAQTGMAKSLEEGANENLERMMRESPAYIRERIAAAIKSLAKP